MMRRLDTGNTRQWEFDLLRGLMLLLMFVTHMPTRFSSPLGQPLGYVSAAEGFVLLSAFMAGQLYTKRAQSAGIPAMCHAFFKRARTVYACHAFLLVCLFSVIAMVGITLKQTALINLVGYYLRDPWSALPGSLLLIYNPPLLDILPLYILLLFASPIVLALGLRHGWSVIFAVSAVLWLGAQFNLSADLYALLVEATGLRVPFNETGSFETFAWQLLWVTGLWLGAKSAGGAFAVRKPFPRHWVILAGVFVMVCFFWRHIVGQVPVPQFADSVLNRLFDKWHLGPLRLLNLAAILLLVVHCRSWLLAHAPRIGFLEKMGAASLPVFCTHLGIVLLALSVVGDYTPARLLVTDVLLMTLGLLALYATAVLTLHLDSIDKARAHARNMKKKSLSLMEQARRIAAQRSRKLRGN
ncbi:MAG: OpgC domain-containing protein [Janthinobacterium lividum]